MKSLLLPTLFALAPLALAQQVSIPSTLPTCAAQCTTLQNALSSCQTNPTTEFSCFCESSLLTPLFSNPPTQLQACTACSSGDLLTIGSWYQNYCKSGGSAAGAPQPSTTSSAAKAPSATSQTTSAASAAATGANQPDSSSGPQGPWFKTHWRWVLMLIVLFVGLSLLAVIFWALHRRYHRRREARFSGALGAPPNINTWGPGQSVHDLGMTVGGAPYQEKGKGKEQTRRLDEPAPARMREMRP